MRFLPVLTVGLLVWVGVFATVNAEDPRTELIGCGSVLFHLAANRLTLQLEEFAVCKRSNPGYDCSDSIRRAISDLQQGLFDLNHCTKDIR
uniref:Uncharacterized protein n=1 Tax=Anopheles quadriannulatus TaxID=34691 RepID=A0A182XL83_ANOQN